VVGAVVGRLRAAGLPVFLIDDGSEEPARTVLAGLHDEASGINVARLEPNQGKGGAVIAGFRMALAAGFTHAVQVDADGQHDLDALADLLALSVRHPTALISGQPVYDETVPLGRKIGRWLTHIWVWIETLSLNIADSMCGFRVYPLAAVAALLARNSVGRRMEFDTEIMVRLFWSGTPVVMFPVKVVYPPDNTSNFDLLADNWRITRMHTRLVVAMLLHLPSILLNRPQHLDRTGSSSVSREP
jgi:glycosyltransferase involved in cell wall biosynthesis